MSRLLLFQLCLASAVFGSGAGAPSPGRLALSPDEPPKVQPTWPDLNIDPPPAPLPPPTPKPDAKGKLPRGAWYIVDHVRPLLIDSFSTNGGAVTVVEKKGPLTVPSSIAVGRKPDADDPDICTVAGPYVYVVKASVTGTVIVEGIPTLNESKDGKPVPFTKADVHRATIDVDAGGPPKPPDPPKPPTPDDPLTQAVREAYRLETDPDKESHLRALALYYRGAAVAYVNDDRIQNWGQLFYGIKAGRIKVIDEGLKSVRKTLGDKHFDIVWPRLESAPFDAAARKLAADSLVKAATVLEAIK